MATLYYLSVSIVHPR